MRYLTDDEVIAIHRQVMRRLGKPPQPLVRPDLLSSALARPIWAAQYEGTDVLTQAARLAIGIARAHAFVDGNKRTAYRAMTTFLRLNGIRMRDPEEALAEILEWAVSPEIGDDEAEARLAAALAGFLPPTAAADEPKPTADG